MVLGSYYLTIDRDDEPGAGKVFRNFDEALMAYDERRCRPACADQGSC